MDLPLPEPLAAPPPYIVQRPATQSIPMVIASPHSGRAYGEDFLSAARLSPLDLRRSEDSFVDELVASAVGLGVPLLCANFPRAYCDPNREAWELDPAMFADPLPDWVNTKSPRVGAGFGTIARLVTSGETIYRHKLLFADAEARIRDCWQPYHDALAGLLAETREQFGCCLLLDCHSMPAGSGRTGGPDFVLGDAHGTACISSVTAFVETLLRSYGYEVRRNDPYSGGYVTRHYGRPRDSINVLQIEIARRLYMDEGAIEKNAGFAVLRRRLDLLLGELATCCGPLLCGGKKKAAPFGTAKFREETSKM